jgi:kynurenine formamidase
MRIFDLSAPVGDNRGEPVPVKVDLLDHVAGAAVLGRSHGVTAADFPDGCAISMETVTLSTHCGTHIDAPLHYGPRSVEGPAAPIDALDLRMFFGPGLLLRFDADPGRGAVTRAEMADALVRAGRMPGPGVIVLCDVGAAALWGTDAYFTQFRGISAEATELLLDAGVQVIGTDAFGFDPPFHAMLDAYRETSRTDALWPAHMLGRRRPYCQIERLSGLTELPADHGFTVACFPIRLTGCGASWTRAVAIMEDVNDV